MKSLHNIEKSAFRRFEYVGYASGHVWRIRKTGFGGWEASAPTTNDYLRAQTLAEMSAKLARRAG